MSTKAEIIAIKNKHLELLEKAGTIEEKLNSMHELISKLSLRMADEQDRISKILAIGDNSIFIANSNITTWVNNVQYLTCDDNIPGLNEIFHMEAISSATSGNRGSFINFYRDYNDKVKEVVGSLDDYKGSCATVTSNILSNINAITSAKMEIIDVIGQCNYLLQHKMYSDAEDDE